MMTFLCCWYTLPCINFVLCLPQLVPPLGLLVHRRTLPLLEFLMSRSKTLHFLYRQRLKARLTCFFWLFAESLTGWRLGSAHWHDPKITLYLVFFLHLKDRFRRFVLNTIVRVHGSKRKGCMIPFLAVILC